MSRCYQHVCRNENMNDAAFRVKFFLYALIMTAAITASIYGIAHLGIGNTL